MNIKIFFRCSFFPFLVGLRTYQHPCKYSSLALLHYVPQLVSNYIFSFHCLFPSLRLYPLQQIHHFLGAFAKLRKATISFVMSVCPSVCLSAWNNSAPALRIFMKFFLSWVFFFENWKSCNNNWYVTWKPIYICDNISLSFS